MKYIFLIIFLFVLCAVGIISFYYNHHERSVVTETVSLTLKAERTQEAVMTDAELPVEVQQLHPESIGAMAQKDFAGRDFTVGRVLARNDIYTRYYITYKSEHDLTISGIMNVPGGVESTKKLPVLFLNHGYIDPVVYTNGRGLKREQDYFARRGYVVVHVDYRGHAKSDSRPISAGKLRGPMEYTEDVINAVVALRVAKLSFVDSEKLGMLGHSMGGGVTQNVMTITPDLVDAYVLFAPVSSDYWETVKRYMIDEGDIGIEEFLVSRGGPKAENPAYWHDISPINYYDRVTGPVMLHHGTADKDVPLSWSHDTRDALQKTNKTIIYHEYPGEPHEFAAAWPTVMKRSLDFFDRHVRAQ